MQPDQVVPLASGAGSAVFLASNANRWLAAYSTSFESQLDVVEIGPDFDAISKPDWGCGLVARAAAIAWQADSFLVAMSSDTEFGGCSAGSIPGSSTRLQVARFSPGLEAELLYEQDLGVRIWMLSLAPRPGGAWLALRAGGEDQDAPIVVRRIGADGAPVGGATEIAQDGDVDGNTPPFDAAPMGDKLAVSFRDTRSGTTRLQLVEGDGTLGASAGVDQQSIAPTSVVASAKSLLVGWVESPAAIQQLRIARFDCLAP